MPPVRGDSATEHAVARRTWHYQPMSRVHLTWASIISLAVVPLAGCSSPSDQQKAHDACVKDAVSQVQDGAEEVDTSKLETSNMSEAMRELIDNPLEPDPTDGVLYATTGDIWYRTQSGDRSQSVLCTVTVVNGEFETTPEAILTPNN